MSNPITKALCHAWESFSYFVFPIQIRRQRQANSSARYVRYPSPASETHNREENEVDFKTAYRDSVYQIRYPDDLMAPEFDSIVMGDPFGVSPVQRLVNFNFLKESDINNPEALDAAKKAYQEFTGKSYEDQVFFDSDKAAEVIPAKNNRESMREYIVDLFESIRMENQEQEWQNNLESLYQNNFYHMTALDLYACDPEYRRYVADIDAKLGDLYDTREKMDEIPNFKGDASYWLILDDSFSEENIRKIQASVKNNTGLKDITPVHYGEGEIPPRRDEHFIPKPKTQFID